MNFHMKRGDLLLVRGGTHTEPGTRYSQGIVVESHGRFGTVMVRWFDGMLHLEEVERLHKYYVWIQS